jgi:hypothetical protein
MKRKEMLKIIEGLFLIANRFPAEMNAENLLSTLEDQGMLPPGWHDDSVGYIRSTGEYGFIRNEWEDEE